MIALLNSWDANGNGEGKGCFTCSPEAFGVGIETLGPDPCLTQCAHCLHYWASTQANRWLRVARTRRALRPKPSTREEPA